MALARTAARGAAWNILSGAGSRVIGLVSTLVVTRFVPPREYGAVSVANAIVQTANDFTGLGLFHFIVATPRAGRDYVFQATILHMILGVVGLCVVLAFQGALGTAFNAPIAIAYIPGLVVAGLFQRLAFPPDRIMVRDLRFGELSLLRGISEVLYSVVTIVLAVFGLGGMSIVYGNIAQQLLMFGALAVITRWREYLQPRAISLAHTRELLRFGVPMAISDSAHMASKMWDNLLVSRYFGTATVGHYNLAYNLADIPATHVGEHIGEVLLPALARVEPEARKSGLIRASRLLALVVFPMAVGLGAVSHTATRAIFDPRWLPMAPMLMILASLSVVRPLGWAIGAYQISRRQPTIVMALELFKVAVLLTLIVALARFGVLWVCMAAGTAFVLHTFGSAIAIRLTDKISLLKLAGAVIPPLLACGPMFLAVWGTRYMMLRAGFNQGVLMLIAETLVGALVFIPSAFVLAPAAARDLLKVGRQALQRDEDDENDDDETSEDDTDDSQQTGGDGAE